MNRVEKAAAIAGIAAIAETIYDKWVARKRNREVAERDQKIRDLEERVAKLERKET